MIRKLLFVTVLAGASTVAFAQSKTPATPATPAKPATPATPPKAPTTPATPAKPAAPPMNHGSMGGSMSADKPIPGPTETVMIVNAKKELTWVPAPPSLPKGAEIAVMSGDPKAEGPFTMRIRMPAKYKVPNHWHPAHEHLTVLEGEFWIGHGETWDEKAMKAVPVGGFIMMPPKHGHYVMTKKKTVLQMNGWGPWAITYFNPSDDPRNAAAAPAGGAPATPATPATPAAAPKLK